MISVANTIEFRISLDALKMTVATGCWRRRVRVLFQPPKDILNIDDRVVHQFADGDGQSAQRHRVDVMPK